MSSTKITLRDYQRRQVDGVYDRWRQGDRNVLNVLPTGGGKTVEMAAIASESVVPGVAIAHRKELINQISRAMASFGVRHNIVAADSTVKSCISRHVELFGRSFYDPRAKFTVSSVDTLAVRADKLAQWANTVGLWMIDECFPAGTLVDSRPIEDIRVGDMVTAFDEVTGEFHQKPVVRLFKNPMPQDMVRIDTTHHVLIVTRKHPIWTLRGWVNAENITGADVLLHVSVCGQTVSGVDGHLSAQQPTVLQRRVFNPVSGQDFIGNDAGHQPAAGVGQDESEQPDAQRNCAVEDDRDVEANRSQALGQRRQRQTCDGSRSDVADNARTLWVQGTGFGQDGVSEVIGVAGTLQDRLCPSDLQDCRGSGRSESFGTGPSSLGRPQGCVPEWVGVESVAVLERGDPDFPRGSHVYNIEVADLHTYTANGLTVHNCHHVLSDNKWGKAVTMFPNAYGVGFTATPVRADKRSLARVQKGVFDAMVTGPTMRELITMGNLCDYRIFAPPASIDRGAITISANGEFSEQSMRKVVHESKIVGDIVASYLRFARGKRGITFVVDVEQATEVAAAYRADGVRAECVSAKTPDAVRESLMRKFEQGALDQLVNVDLFGEGLDVPAVEVVSMGRPTESYGLFVQQFGRALRTLAGKSAGIIIDHVGNVVRHGLPDAPRNWTLIADQRGKRSARDPDAIPVTTCPECFKAYESLGAACPYCGFKPEPAGRSRPEQVDGDLIELDPSVLAQMRGEVARVDGQPIIPFGASDIVAAAVRKRWAERQDAQDSLRLRIAEWAGVLHGRGAPDAEIYRRFYHRFGVDIMTAQTLNARDALELKERIDGHTDQTA